MPEHITETSLVKTLKADVAQTVSLYFAPVRAVVKEFNKAIAANGEDKKVRKREPSTA